MIRKLLTLSVCAMTAMAGCREDGGKSITEPATAAAAAPTNRVDIPPTVRNNLGITFAHVEARHVARTIRVPGSFELSPEARREYRTMAGGRIELHVAQFEVVQEGQPLYSLDSHDWRDLQQRLNETQLQLEQSKASAAAMGPLLVAHESHHAELEKAVEIWQLRTDQLEASRASGVVTDEDYAQARGTLATAKAELAEVLEKEAELRLRKAQVSAELNAHRERFELMLANAGSLLAVPVESLLETDPQSPQQHPRWLEIRNIEIRAQARGVVESLSVTTGAWADESSLVLTIVQPDRLRFRARGLQSDLNRLRDGLTGRIVAPKGSGPPLDGTMEGTVALGLTADPDERTVELFMTPTKLSEWARPGVAAHLEITAEGGGAAELAIPLSATIRDGLETIIFRRDPANPDKVIRMEADLGISDGNWIVISSGVKEGDQVVLDGVYPLMLATSGSAQKGGHFHADGTWHEGDN